MSHPIPQPNVNNMSGPVAFVPVFAADGNVTYTNLGSSYEISDDGAQVLVNYKFRAVTGLGTTLSSTISLPIAATATLNEAIFAPTPLVVASTGASTETLTNLVSSNSATVLGITSAAVTASTTYVCGLSFKYMVNEVNN